MWIILKSEVNKNLVLIFVKEPKLGFVKTRLAKICGDDFVLELYKNFVKDLILTLKKSESDFKLCAYPSLELVTKTFGNFDNFLQVDGDLGKKMQKAFEEQFAKGYEKIVLIGSDIPHVTSEILDKSFKELKSNDTVLGPSEDGGYYLIGFNKDTFYSEVFQDIPWSTHKVLENTLHKLNTKQVYFLQELNDIDVIDDLKDFYKIYKNSYFKDSFTMQFLKENKTWKNLML